MTYDPLDGFPSAEWDTEIGLFNSACTALIEAVLDLVPDYARASIHDFQQCRSETTGDERRIAMRKIISTARNESDAKVVKAGLNAVAYATWAMKQAAEEDGAPMFYNFNLYADACRLFGLIQGHLGVQLPDLEEVELRAARYALAKSLSDRNKIAAAGRHKEDRNFRVEALAYFAQHRASFKSKDDAATFIAKRIVPAAFSTVRRWLQGL